MLSAKLAVNNVRLYKQFFITKVVNLRYLQFEICQYISEVFFQESYNACVSLYVRVYVKQIRRTSSPASG